MRGPLALLTRPSLRRVNTTCGLLSMLFAVMLLSSFVAGAQTLARQGWVGSGYTVDPWWKGAVFLEIDPLTFPGTKGEAAGDLRGVVSRLDYLQALGVDAIVLPPIELKVTNGTGRRAYLRPGSEEEFGLLITEAIRRKIRVVVDLPLRADQSDEELACTARFLLSRGVAALRLTPDPRPDAPPIGMFERSERLRALRLLCGSYGSERVLLWDLPDASSAEVPTADVAFAVRQPSPRVSPHGSHQAMHALPLRADETIPTRFGPQMVVNHKLALLALGSGDEVRGTLLALGRENRRVGPQPVLSNYSSDHVASNPGSPAPEATPIHDPALAKVAATVLLASRGGSLLRAGQELGMVNIATGAGRGSFTAKIAAEDATQDSLLNWYRKLNLLKHNNPALRDGSMEMLTTSNPDVVAWTRRAKVGGAASPTVVVVCNLSPHANGLSLRGELQRLGVGLGDGRLHGLLSSASVQGGSDGAASVASAASIDSLDLEANAVYVGELRPQRGLETISLAPHRSRKRSR